MPKQPKIACVIPARYASTRLPGKPLIKINGLTMVERVYRQASQSKLASAVVVATEDERVADCVRAFGGNYIMTGDNHHSGTDRIAEVATLRPEFDVIVNVQGDQPMIDPRAIDAAIEPFLSDNSLEMSTIAAELSDLNEAGNPNIVKVVTDAQGFALYFSRSPIPFFRGASPAKYLAHTGLYVYSRKCLLRLAALPPSALELAESLEQLRALENGIRIRVCQTNFYGLEVNVPEDVPLLEQALSESSPVMFPSASVVTPPV